MSQEGVYLGLKDIRYLQGMAQLLLKALYLQLSRDDPRSVRGTGGWKATQLFQRSQLLQLLLQGRHLSITLLMRQRS